jgi:hypothetical protein
MKTAVQAVFSELEELHPNLFNVNTTEGKQFINHFHKYLAIEREQIIKAYETAMETDIYNEPLKIGKDYYKETFKPESNETL